MKALNATKRAFGRFGEDDAMVYAAAVAYYSALSLAPLLLLLLWVAGLLGPDAQQALVAQVRDVVGGEAGRMVESIVTSASDHPSAGTWSGIVGIAALLLSATGVFVQLQKAMNRVWGVRVKKGAGLSDLLRKRVLSLGLILAMGFLLAVSLAASAAVSFLASRLLPGTPFLWQILSFALSVAIFALLFAAMFRYLPDVKVAWRDVRIGAVVTAMLFALGKLAIGLYLGHGGVGSAYGAAGSLLVLLVWVYFSTTLFFLGAEWTRSWAAVHGRELVPDRHARPA